MTDDFVDGSDEPGGPVPLVSVLLTTYRHERYIEEALRSAILQETRFPIEILVGDDHSPDRTGEIARAVAAEAPDRVRVFSYRRNIGGHRNVDYLWRTARGKFIAWLEGDDFWCHPLKLQRQVDALEANQKATICFHAADMWNESTGKSIGQLPGQNTPITKFQDLVFGNFIMTPTVMYRRGNINSLPEWIWSLTFGDWPLHLLFATRGDIVYLHEKMAVYRMHPLGIWSNRSQIDKITETIRVLEEVQKHLPWRYRGISDVALLRLYHGLRFDQEKAGLPLTALPPWTARKAKIYSMRLNRFLWREAIVRNQELCRYL